MVWPDVGLVLSGNKVDARVPFLEQVMILNQFSKLSFIECETVADYDVLPPQPVFRCPQFGGLHVELSALRAIKSTDKSAGVTPLIREAWPIDRG